MMMPKGQQHRESFKSATRRKDGHPYGYVPPIRQNTNLIGAHVPFQIAEAFRMASKAEGKTMKELLMGFILEKTTATLSPKFRKQFIEQEVERVRARYGRSLTPSSM